MSCQSNRYYSKIRNGFDSFYCLKQERKDSIRLLIFHDGIPHYTYWKIYADKNGNIFKIIKERDGVEFYQAATDFKNGNYYFNNRELQIVDTLQETIRMAKFLSTKQLNLILSNKYCTNLKLPDSISLVKIEKPTDYIDHLLQRKLLKKYKIANK